MIHITNLIHSTSLAGYNGIVMSGHLLNQPALIEKGIIIIGEGGADRRIGDKMVTLEDEDWYKKYDEGRGIYFRVETNISKCTNPFSYGGDVIMEFSPKLLEQYPNWILNTEENFGFVLGKHGEEVESPFSGNLGKTFYGTYEEGDLDDMCADDAELVFDVPIVNLDNLVNVKFKTEAIHAEAMPPPVGKKHLMGYIIEFLSKKLKLS
jgi:hypothetical protein